MLCSKEEETIGIYLASAYEMGRSGKRYVDTMKLESNGHNLMIDRAKWKKEYILLLDLSSIVVCYKRRMNI